MILTINIPKRGQKITNGDVIQALFPKGVVSEEDSVIVEFWIDEDRHLFWKDWWNAPYKAK